MRIVLLGPPGAGKGTQAARVAARRGIPHISTGDMMRQAHASGSDLGRRVGEYLDAGRLVPDELIIDVVRERLGRPDAAQGFLLDGFPRTLAQAEALDALLADLGLDLTHVLEFRVPHDVLKQRLLERGARDGRSDDTPEVIEHRLRVYEDLTRPVSDHYGRAGLLVAVDGVGDIEAIHREVSTLLEDSGAAGPRD